MNDEKAEWIIYVTDVGQQKHFDMFFKARSEYHLYLPGICYCSVDTSSFYI
jgi:hypothetical protein